MKQINLMNNNKLPMFIQQNSSQDMGSIGSQQRSFREMTEPEPEQLIPESIEDPTTA
jgi:hypothetical protein